MNQDADGDDDDDDDDNINIFTVHAAMTGWHWQFSLVVTRWS